MKVTWPKKVEKQEYGLLKCELDQIYYQLKIK